MVFTGEWRPENWERIRREIAQLPTEWSMSKPSLSAGEQIAERTAEVLMEAIIAELGKTPSWVKGIGIMEKETGDANAQSQDAEPN